jgi:hypothetical protein
MEQRWRRRRLAPPLLLRKQRMTRRTCVRHGRAAGPSGAAAGAGEHNGIVQRRRPTEGDVHLKQIDEARRINLWSERSASRQAKVRNWFVYSSTDPARRRRTNSPKGLSVIGGPNHWWTSCTNWRQDGGPAVSSRRAYQSWGAPVRCMVAYRSRLSSGVPWPWKKVSHRFNRGSRSFFLSKQGNSRRTRGWN